MILTHLILFKFFRGEDQAGVVGSGGSNSGRRGNGRDSRKSKKRIAPIRFSDLDEIERLAAKIAQESIPMEAVRVDGSVEGDHELENDELLLQALLVTRILH